MIVYLFICLFIDIYIDVVVGTGKKKDTKGKKTDSKKTDESDEEDEKDEPAKGKKKETKRKKGGESDAEDVSTQSKFPMKQTFYNYLCNYLLCIDIYKWYGCCVCRQENQEVSSWNTVIFHLYVYPHVVACVWRICDFVYHSFFLTSGLFIYPVGEYIKLYHLLLPFKDTMNKPGRPNKELSMIRKEATDAWEELVKTNVDVSDLPKPFWTFKKVCSSAYD